MNINKRIRKNRGLLNMFSLARLVPGRRCRNYLSKFTEVDDLGRNFDLLFTVKHEKQLALNRLVGQRLTKGKPMRVLGSKNQREYRQGLLVHFDREDQMIKMPLKEPFGVQIYQDYVAVASSNTVRLYNLKNETVNVYKSEWFAQLHSVNFSEDGCRLLVASTGYDTVMEFDIHSCEITWFWNSWDSGFNQSPAGVELRRSPTGIDIYDKGKKLNQDGQTFLDGFGLPTGLSATHLNNAQYFGKDMICITLFHQGKAILVNRNTGSVSEVLRGLLSPHGFEPAWNGEIIVTDTRRGRAIFFDDKFLVRRTMIFDKGDYHPSREGLGEWLQNVLPLKDNLYAGIDINRSCIWLFDIDEKIYRKIDIPSDWAVQNVIGIDTSVMRGLSKTFEHFESIEKQITDPSAIL